MGYGCGQPITNNRSLRNLAALDMSDGELAYSARLWQSSYSLKPLGVRIVRTTGNTKIATSYLPEILLAMTGCFHAPPCIA
jgi:hypothetical protein